MSIIETESACRSFQEYERYDMLRRDPSLAMSFCGIEKCLPGHGYGHQKRDLFLIHFILDGHGMIEYRGKKLYLEKAQSFLIYPEELVYYKADLIFPWKYCWIAFRGNLAKEIVQEIGYTHEQPVCSFRDVDIVEKRVSDILSCRGERLGDYLHREGLFFQLISGLIRQGAEEDGREEENGGEAVYTPGAKEFTTQAIHYLETHFREKIRIQTLAQQIGISRSYLTQQIKEEIGMSPRAFLISVRMGHAKEYLAKSNDPIQLVAMECGYDDALAFSKAFKAQFGMSPSKYRQQQKEAAQD